MIESNDEKIIGTLVGTQGVKRWVEGDTHRFYTAEEDAILKEYAGKKAASTIAIMIERSTGSIYHRIKKLGLSGKICGEDHHAAKLSNLQTQMILALYQAGFTVTEIHDAAITHVSFGVIDDCVSARTHKTR
jgi:3-deoxy-D-manno-octulosonate 8-phosphate phosphatase KdsC-like HAD superfamily phosphatase